VWLSLSSGLLLSRSTRTRTRASCITATASLQRMSTTAVGTRSSSKRRSPSKLPGHRPGRQACTRHAAGCLSPLRERGLKSHGDSLSPHLVEVEVRKPVCTSSSMHVLDRMGCRGDRACCFMNGFPAWSSGAGSRQASSVDGWSLRGVWAGGWGAARDSPWDRYRSPLAED
jgi:hypothetical protein